MDRARLYVDFNEMVEPDLVLLSQEDTKLDSSGAEITLREGLEVHVYQDDIDETGGSDPLVADGLAERCTGDGWAHAARWCCRIDSRGVRHLSDEPA